MRLLLTLSAIAWLESASCKSSDSSSSGTAGTTGGGTGAAGTSGPGTGGTGTGAGGTGPTSAATFMINVSLSSAIGTVAIVTWSVNVSIDSAVIDFGRDESNLEFEAPVDLTQASYRTLLLGMKPATTYSLRITAKGGGNTYVSDVSTIKTQYLPNGLPVFTVADSNASALYAGGGFTVNCIGLAGSPGIPGTAGKTAVFILDQDGVMVWALDIISTTANNCSRARMSYDGQSMWAANFANGATNGVV